MQKLISTIRAVPVYMVQNYRDLDRGRYQSSSKVDYECLKIRRGSSSGIETLKHCYVNYFIDEVLFHHEIKFLQRNSEFPAPFNILYNKI